jgi:6-phosphogluconolactonase
MKPRIKIFENPENLAENVALEFQIAVQQSSSLNRHFFMALSGGSTPKLFFQKLASFPYRNSISWQHVHFFWGDERCVPPDHPDSNYGMTKQNLLDHISIPAENVHRILGEVDPTVGAKRYSNEIEVALPMWHSGFPQFDWILLGMGSDGHIASIFPGLNVLDGNDICTVATHPETGQKRITLTLPVINHAKRVSFLVTGENKAKLVAKILGEAGDIQSLPASFVQPVNGILEWYLDKDSGRVKRA